MCIRDRGLQFAFILVPSHVGKDNEDADSADQIAADSLEVDVFNMKATNLEILAKSKRLTSRKKTTASGRSCYRQKATCRRT